MTKQEEWFDTEKVKKRIEEMEKLTQKQKDLLEEAEELEAKKEDE